MMREVWVDAVAVWGSRLPGWEQARAILRGEAAAPPTPATRPAPALLPANERRRAPDSVAIALEVAARACAAADRDPKSLTSVFASTHGDLAITDYMCETLAHSPTLLSPTRFHNSVHNAAAGYWTIATGCMRPYTALSAGGFTFGEGLLEALAQAACDATAVLYVAYDIEARGPLASMAPSAGMLAVALVLAAQASARSEARLDWELCEQAAPRDPPAVHAGLVAGNGMASSLPLLEAIATRKPASLTYPLGPGLVLQLAVDTAAAGAG